MRSKLVFQSVIAVVLVGAAFNGRPGARQGDPASIAFTHVNVIDGTGRAIRLNQTVVTTAGRIVAAGDAGSVSVPTSARAIDATGKYLIPGLWDLHVHTRYAGIDHLRLFIANGVTGVRDMGGPWEHLDIIKHWRREIASGDRIGPRIVAAGVLVDGPGSGLDFSAVVDGPDQARAVVRRLKESGADFVKFYDLLSQESFAAIVDEAKHQKLPIAGHTPLAVGLQGVLNAGVLSVEHATGVFLAASSREQDIMARARKLSPADLRRLLAEARGDGGFDRAKAADVAALLNRHRTVVVPTLSAFSATLASTRKQPRVADRLRYVPAAYRAIWAGAGTPNDDTFETRRELTRMLRDAGVELLAGTDVVKAQFIPGFSLHDELSLLVSIGMSPTEALQAATRKPARLLGFNDVGTIEAGMRADLVLLDANPLENIGNTRRIAAVMAGARLFDRKALDALLADIESEAARWKGEPTDRYRAGSKPPQGSSR